MKRFDELGIRQEEDRKMFDCQQVSISEVINCEIEVLDFIPNITTSYGDSRSLVHYRHDGKEGKFFTNSTAIKNALNQIPKAEFPFITTIRCIKCGNGKIYQFT